MKTFILFLTAAFSLFISGKTQAQTNIFPSTGSAGIGTTTPNASSILDMVSTTKGMLVPRMTKNQRDAIASPATGLLIYVTSPNISGFYYYNGTVWTVIAPKAGWSLAGNAGTNPATNFIGTTDAQPLVFKVNNQKAGYLGTTTNTAFGYQTLNATSGLYNTANGFQALYANTTGHDNTANGFWSLASNTIGYYNTATGGYSLYANSDGIGNTANGISALRFNTHGSDNTAVGANTLFYNTTGTSNVAVGSNALFNNVTSAANVAVGDSALYNQTGGMGANVAVGYWALNRNLNGSNNVANGALALVNNDAGSYNTASGNESLFNNNDGNGNTAFGYEALYSNLHGSHNTAAGYHADVSSGSFSNSTALGYNAQATASNQVMLGNTSVTSVKAAASFVIYSDGRFKKNIKENVPGLDFIKQLKPVTYNYDIYGLNKFIGLKNVEANGRKTSDAAKQNEDAINNKEKKLYTGFVAQDVEKAADKLGYDFSGVYKPQNDKDPYGLSYADFVVPLVKAVQELSSQNDSLKQNNRSLNDKLNSLSDKINQMENAMRQCCSSFSSNMQSAVTNQSAVKKSDVAALEQNIPNPFNESTSIHYSLPQKYSSAKIIVIDESGNTIKIFSLSGTGKGTLNFSSPFRVGASYQYSLFIDGTLIDTKQMVLAK